MANGNVGQLGSILQGLIQLGSQGTQAVGRGAQKAVQASPVALISQLLGQASNIPAQQQVKQSTQGTAQRIEAFDEKSLLPLQQDALKTAKKIQTQQIEEAAQGGVPLTNILQTAGVPQEAISRVQDTQVAPTQPQIGAKERNLLVNLFNLAGFRAPQAKFGEREKLQIQNQNRLEQIRETARLKGAGVDDDAALAQVAKESALNIIGIRASIPLKGPIGGPIGALGGAFGLGTEKRAEFDSAVQQFVFDIGALLGQKGRAFTEKEQELVRKKVIQASLSAKESDFRGRMKAVFKRINSLAGETIIDESVFSGQRRGRNVVDDELEAINKQLDKLGGR